MKKLFTGVLWLFFVGLAAEAKATVVWSLFCPNDTTVSCDADITNLSRFGTAYYHDAYGYHDAGAPVVSKHLNGCGGGYITRTWTVEDPYWNWQKCTQTIYIGLPGGLFKEKNIHWPQKEVYLTGCDADTDPSKTGKPTYDQIGCSMIAVGKTDNLYEVNSSCKKLIRRWKVMDWCQAGAGGWGNDGIWYYDQYIMIINNEIPEVECPSDTTIVVEDCNYGDVVLPSLEVDPSSCGGQYTISNNSPYATSKGANASGRYPVGKTKVTYAIQYGCGSKKYCDFYITVKGGKVPTPICVAELAIGLMGKDTNSDGVNDEGMVQIWAKDLNLKSEPGCSGGSLNYSFSPDSIVMFRTFTCADLGPNPVKMYVSDHSGNQSYCLVNVIVQNNKANITPCERAGDEGNEGDDDEEDEEDDSTPGDSTSLVLAGKVVDAYGKALSGIKMKVISENQWTYVTVFDTITVEKQDSFVNSSGITIHYNYTDTLVVSSIDSSQKNPQVYIQSTDQNGQFRFAEDLQKNANYYLQPEAGTAPLPDIEDLKVLVDLAFGYKPINSDEDLFRADLNDDGLVNMDDVDLFIQFMKDDQAEFYGKYRFIFNDEIEATGLNYENLQASKLQEKVMILFKGELSEVKPSKLKTPENNIQGLLASRINEFEMYPNPTAGNLNIHFRSLNEGKIYLRLYDQTGKLVQTENWQAAQGSQTLTTDISRLQTGIYFYQVQSDYSQFNGKIFRE